MSESVLFEGYEPAAPPLSRDPGLSPDQRRTLRQAEGIRVGKHPLTGRALHELSSRHATKTDPKGQPYTCSSCIFRVVYRYHDRSLPKCRVNDGERDTRSASSDVRAWWPACPEYSAGDPTLSPDAARNIPTPTEGATP